MFPRRGACSRDTITWVSRVFSARLAICATFLGKDRHDRRGAEMHHGLITRAVDVNFHFRQVLGIRKSDDAGFCYSLMCCDVVLLRDQLLTAAGLIAAAAAVTVGGNACTDHDVSRLATALGIWADRLDGIGNVSRDISIDVLCVNLDVLH